MKKAYVMIVLQPDGTARKLVQPREFSYDQVKQAVGGFIQECLYFTKLTHSGTAYARGVAYCDEEGRLRGLPHNAAATAAWCAACPAGDPGRMQLVGNVVFLAREAAP